MQKINKAWAATGADQSPRAGDRLEGGGEGEQVEGAGI